jgi:hypothetical protein
VILVGHSAGGWAVLSVARKLRRKDIPKGTGHESVTRDPRIRDLVLSTVQSLHAATASPGGRHAQSQS